MLGDIEGYCIIKQGAKGISTIPLENFYEKRIRVLEFGHGDCVLVVNNESTALATFEKEAVKASFKCGATQTHIFPPGLDIIQQMAYISKLETRKGGWDPILKEMVIQYSLMKGEYTDNLLWQKQ